MLVHWIHNFLALYSNTLHFVGTPSQYDRIYGPGLPTSSVITGMPGTKAGVSPPRSSPLVFCIRYSSGAYQVPGMVCFS